MTDFIPPFPCLGLTELIIGWEESWAWASKRQSHPSATSTSHNIHFFPFNRRGSCRLKRCCCCVCLYIYFCVIGFSLVFAFYIRANSCGAQLLLWVEDGHSVRSQQISRSRRGILWLNESIRAALARHERTAHQVSQLAARSPLAGYHYSLTTIVLVHVLPSSRDRKSWSTAAIRQTRF